MFEIKNVPRFIANLRWGELAVSGRTNMFYPVCRNLRIGTIS